MEAWGWLLVYVVGFGLVQALLYRYLHRDDPSPDAAPVRGERSARMAFDGSSGTRNAAGIHCTHCGAFNESVATYAYCRECIQRLE